MKFIDFFIVFTYLITLTLYGMIVSKGVKSIKDFSVSNVDYSVFILFATICSSFIGGGFSTGSAAEVYTYGIRGFLVLFGFTLSQFFISIFIAPKINVNRKVYSTGLIIERAYGKNAKIITGIISTLFCAGLIGAQLNAIGSTFETFLGISNIVGILIGFSLVLIYSTSGGMKAVVGADVIQFVVLSVGLALLFFFSMDKVGWILGLKNSLPEEYFNPLNKVSLIEFTSLFATVFLGEMLTPSYVQRLLISKKRQKTTKATFFAGVYSIPFFLCIGFIGLCAVVILKDNTTPSTILPSLINTIMPVGLKGFLIASMIAIVTSSADSGLNSASISLTSDVILALKKKEVSENFKLNLVRIINVLIGICSIIYALFFPNAFRVLVFTYSFWAPTVLVPLIFAITGKKASKLSFYASIFFGIVSTIIWKVVLKEPFYIDGAVVGFLCNLVVFLFCRNK